MKQENVNYPPLNDLEGMTVDELFALRQKCREVRDNIFHRTNEESDNIQAKLRREYHIERHHFDMQLDELRRQLDELRPRQGEPAARIEMADIRTKMTELKYQFSCKREDYEAKLAQSATERMRKRAQAQLEYENAEIAVCKAIRDKNGFLNLGLPNQSIVRTADNPNGTASED